MDRITMDETKGFIDFLTGEFQKNIAASNQSVVVHASTRDCLQRICDQLPKYLELYKSKQVSSDSQDIPQLEDGTTEGSDAA